MVVCVLIARLCFVTDHALNECLTRVGVGVVRIMHSADAAERMQMSAEIEGRAGFMQPLPQCDAIVGEEELM